MDSMVFSEDKVSTISSGRLTIDLEAYAGNWRLLRDLVNKDGAPCECAAMVKADAYGISIEKAVGALVNAGCETFFVASASEGMAVRAVTSKSTVYILNGLLPNSSSFFISNSLRPILNSIDEVREWALEGCGAPAALHVDTGMNRLGVRAEEAKTLFENKDLVSKLNLTLIMSHLACGDTPGAELNGCQLKSFKEITSLFPGVKRSLCNSAGIFHGSSFHLDMVRPGIALYGGAALTGHSDENPMKPVVKVEARVLQIRDVPEHESVGYGGAEVLSKEARIATISAGYADGYIRQAGSTTNVKGARAFVNGQFVPLVGRVSMDLIAIDVSAVDDIARGDYVELFGPNVSVSEVARHAKTIDYEFLTGLGKRYQRVYGPLNG